MDKTFDIGNGIVSASIGANGRAVTVSRANKKHGYVLLTPIQKFDNQKWYDKKAVRAYRNLVLNPEIQDKGYALDFDFQKGLQNSSPEYYEKANVLYSKEIYDNFELKKQFFISPSSSSLTILYEISNISVSCVSSEFTLSGDFGIIRASYAQITENGPIPLPETNNFFTGRSPSSFSLYEAGTSSYAQIDIVGEFNILTEEPLQNIPSALPSKINFRANLRLEPGQKSSIALLISLDENKIDTPTKLKISDLYEELNNTVKFWEVLYIDLDDKSMEYIVNRNFAYTFGCCCIEGYGAMITDHQSLPLTWNRDNYYMFKLIESYYRLNRAPELLTVMKNHIKWLFEFITDQGWGRSHLINGRVKDYVFQFDQQCYPILELCDYLEICADPEIDLAVIMKKIDNLSEIILSHKGDEATLFRTEENPADDPVLFPYHFSTQILAWKTFDALHKMNLKYSFSDKNYAQIRDSIRSDILKYMISEKEGKRMFCYTTDLKGNYEFYNDANDLPFALAPLWSFIDARNEVFINSVEWSFSKNNRGYYHGTFGGLGSDHAEAHWPLGDSQLLAIAMAQINSNEKSGEILWDDTLEMLKSIAQKDGLFSESVFPDTGKVYTRYYFAWPGAAVSWLYLIKNKLNNQL